MNPLVVVFLRGAADGLSILTPPDSQYRTMRPDLATPENQLLELSEGWGMHPNLKGLHKRVVDGSAAIVPAVGLGDGNRSHFAAQHSVEIGGGSKTGGSSAEADGWIGRHLRSTATDEADPFRAVALGALSMPATLRGSTDVVAARTLGALRLGAPLRRRATRVTGEPLRAEWFTAAWAATATPKSAANGVELVATVQDRLSAIAAAADASSQGTDAEPPDERSGAATAMFRAASQVLGSGLGTEVVMLNLGGWDTHNEQGSGADGLLARLLADLDGGLDEFLAGQREAAAPANVLVISEFGRRVAQNSSLGTDHGSGGVAMFAGASAAGGIRGEWPGLNDLVEGDVRPVNRTETILAEVADVALSTPDVAAVIPGVDRARYVGICR